MSSREHMPCKSALRRETSLPALVFGPVDLALLRRLAAIRFSDAGFLVLQVGLAMTVSPKMEIKRVKQRSSPL